MAHVNFSFALISDNPEGLLASDVLDRAFLLPFTGFNGLNDKYYDIVLVDLRAGELSPSAIKKHLSGYTVVFIA